VPWGPRGQWVPLAPPALSDLAVHQVRRDRAARLARRELRVRSAKSVRKVQRERPVRLVHKVQQDCVGRSGPRGLRARAEKLVFRIWRVFAATWAHKVNAARQASEVCRVNVAFRVIVVCREKSVHSVPQDRRATPD
jgi:hypothetical protein